MTPRALLAGPGAARALRTGGPGRVEVAIGGGGYVRLGAEWVLLTGPRAIVGPLSLLVAGLGDRPLEPLSPAWVEDEATLAVGGLRIDLSAVRTADRGRAPIVARAGRGAALAAAAAAAAPPPLALRPGLDALAGGRVRDAVRLLAGRGEGLTPAGDDGLAGYAGWAAATGATPELSALAAGRASPIGLAYLRCAERGELPAPAAATIAAVLAGDREAAARRARVLRRWGGSSGSALLWGIGAGARWRPATAEENARARGARE